MAILMNFGDLVLGRGGYFVLFSVPLTAVLCLFWVLFQTRDNRRDAKLSSSGHGKPIFSTKNDIPHVFPREDSRSMGVIEPLLDLKWDTIEPPKIYKFNPKYFLTMGLRTTTINHITHIDKEYLSRLKGRQQTLDEHPDAVACLPTGVSVVRELYTYLVATYLPQRYPTIFKLVRQENMVPCLLNSLTGDMLPLLPPDDPLEALRSLTTTIDEDFIMLLPTPSPSTTTTTTTASPPPSSSSPDEPHPFTLHAYTWCYPAGFRPSALLGLPLSTIHAPVPGYEAKLEKSMDRYFARLEPGHVVSRTNWSVATSPALYEDGNLHLYGDEEDDEKSSHQSTSAASPNLDVSKCRVRCELQTLFALPETGARVLSLHLYVYTLQQIKDDGMGSAMCEAINGLRSGNVPGMWRYKRAVVWGESVKNFLRS